MNKTTMPHQRIKINQLSPLPCGYNMINFENQGKCSLRRK
jgi:hypothetical protein